MTEMMINGEAFNVLVEGDEGAPALMLAHSLGTNLHIFDKLMPELLRHFRVIRYDARGHGSSVVTPAPYSIEQLGSDALRIMDALDLEKVDWLGLSMGGLVGMSLLTSAPQRIGRAVLANVAAHFGSPDLWNERIRITRERGLESLAPAVLENWFTKGFREEHPEEMEKIWEMVLSGPPEGYVGGCAALRDMDLREAVRSTTNPVLVIVGRHDPLTTPGLGALVASAIPGARLVTLETAHMSCVEDPQGFDAAAIEFLISEAPTAAAGAPAEAPPQQPPKPRKPRAPRKPAAPKTEANVEVAPSAATMPSAEPESQAAPAAPAAVVVSVPQPRKRPAKRAAAKKAAPKKAPVRKAPAKKAPAKKAAAKKALARKMAVKKSPARKAVAKKAATKKAATKKTAMRKVRAAAPARKAVVKKTVAKKSAARKAAARKAVTKKVAKKTPMRKTAAKKALVRKAVVKRTQAKKTASKKTAAKKSAARKPMPRHLPGRRPTRKR